jgi:hypothetical protein
MPSVLPRTSWLPAADFDQPPRWHCAFFCGCRGQHDRLGDHQFGHAAGVGIGRVEHRDAGQLGRVQVDLVGADAEAAHRDQALGSASTSALSWVRERMPTMCASAMRSFSSFSGSALVCARSGCSRRR